jgi:hypothetical protein
MINEPNPSKSYQPKIILVSQEYYKKNHIDISGFNCGSSIILSPLRKQIYCFTDKDNVKENETKLEKIQSQIDYIKKILSEAYSTQIRYNKKIKVKFNK